MLGGAVAKVATGAVAKSMEFGFSVAIDTGVELGSSLVNGEKITSNGFIQTVEKSLVTNAISAGLGSFAEDVIDNRQVSKFADAERNLIAQERANQRRCESICEAMQKEARKADTASCWSQMGRTAKQRERALDAVTRHNNNADMLERKYSKIAEESLQLRSDFNDALEKWGNKVSKTTDNVIGGLINLVDNIHGMYNQEGCA